MNIYGEKVVLRAIEERDCELLREMFNSPEIEHLVVGWAYPLSEYAQKKWYSNHYDTTEPLRLIIADKDDNALGMVALTELDWKNRSAVTGIKIAGKENRGKGIGTDALKALIKYCFDELQLNRIESVWLADNHASAALHKKVGFKQEGTKRQAIFCDGRYHDMCIGSILVDEYRSDREKG